jgi:predicted lipid carrier protein YhbT
LSLYDDVNADLAEAKLPAVKIWESLMLPNPLKLIPKPPLTPVRYLLNPALNRLFSTAIAKGELDFLEDKVLQAVISGIDLHFDITLKQNKLVVSAPGENWDLRIAGSFSDFLQLATRQEDADTLFFQRRITTEGDTELGLYLKNFLDSQELPELPFSGLLMQGVQMTKRIVGR